MINTDRIWAGPRLVVSLEELAERLSSCTFPICAAFEWPDGKTRLLNDSFSEDGAQEFGVLRLLEDRWVQVESITFSWCSKEKALDYLEQAARGDFDTAGMRIPLDPQFHLDTETCRSCR